MATHPRQTMRSLRRMACLTLLALACAGVQAQAPGAGEAPRLPGTGDPAMDARLVDMDQYGGRYREAFLDELVRYHAAPRTLSGALLADEGWAPGDLYFACALAETAGRPCRHVIDLRRGSRDEGWEAVATRLGIPPGSEAFARILEGIEDSYARWGRPLPAARSATP